MIGSPYDIIIPAFTRTMVADDVLLRLSAPSTGILLVYRAWYGMIGTDDLNEPNMISFVRLSTDGVSGGTVTFEQKMEDHPAFPGTAASLDAAWGTPPTITDTFAPQSWNLATGWEWAAQSESDYFVVAPSQRIGLKMIDASSVSMNWGT